MNTRTSMKRKNRKHNKLKEQLQSATEALSLNLSYQGFPMLIVVIHWLTAPKATRENI